MREITINGKVVVAETGFAPAPIPAGRDKTDFRLLCEALKPGESALLPMTASDIQAKNLYCIGKAIGKRLSYRQEGNGVRIFCLPGAVSKASLANGASAPRNAKPSREAVQAAW